MPGYKPWKLQIISRISLHTIPLLKIIIVRDSTTDHVVDTEDTSGDDVDDDDGVAYDGRRQQCKQRVMVSQAAAVVLSGWVITGSSS